MDTEEMDVLEHGTPDELRAEIRRLRSDFARLSDLREAADPDFAEVPDPTDPIKVLRGFTRNRRDLCDPQFRGLLDRLLDKAEGVIAYADRAGAWRLGSHYEIHVYEGDRPVATFHNPADARAAVAAVNRMDPVEREAAVPGGEYRWHDVLMSVACRLELPRSESGPPDDPAVYEKAIDGLEQLYTDELKRRQEAEAKLFAAPSPGASVTASPADGDVIEALRPYFDAWERKVRGHSGGSSIWHTNHTPVTYRQHEAARAALSRLQASQPASSGSDPHHVMTQAEIDAVPGRIKATATPAAETAPDAGLVGALLVDEAVATTGYTHETLKALEAAGITFPAECWSSSQAINRWQREKRREALASLDAVLEAK